jgi:hypothetical protein
VKILLSLDIIVLVDDTNSLGELVLLPSHYHFTKNVNKKFKCH